jgi:hypothetical protein
VAAQGPVSAALGRDEQAYRLTGLQVANPAQHLRAGFSRRGAMIVSGRARLGMTLSGFGYASALTPLRSINPRASAGRVRYAEGSLTEWFANGPLGIEQGFDLAARPSAGGGPLTFSLALSGNLVSRLQGDSVQLEGRGVALRYGDLIATDAHGRVLHSWLQLVRGHVLIRVDDRGAAYPLRIDPFIQQAELSASNSAAGDQLGWSVAVSGDTIVAGAPFRNVGPNVKQGTAYVFVMPAAGWAGATQTAELTASDGAAGDALGYSVAVAGSTVVASAPGHTAGSNPGQGAAYVFVMPASGWAKETQTAELTASNGARGEELGSSVAVAGNTIVAGAPFQTVGSHAEEGAAYVFAMPAAGWAGSLTPTAELTASDGAAGDQLGYSVATSGDTLLAGAYRHKVGANAFQGAAYVFLAPLPSVVIASPANGATYTQGQAVAAGYSCSAPAGATVTACTGPVADGAAIETTMLGQHTFAVNTADSEGLSASESASYVVVAGPVLSGLSETAKTWREGNALAHITAKQSSRARKLPVGTTFSFSLNIPASATFTFTNQARGRKVGKTCMAETRTNNKRHRCTRTVIAGTLTFSAHAGANELRFDGLISKHKRLAPGSYTVLVSATASDRRSPTGMLHFAIANRRVTG